MKKQNIVGKKTEEKIANFFKVNMYWAFIIPKGINGQPFDIIARREDKVWFVDAKHLDNDKINFSFERIEPNQETSMNYALHVANIKNKMGFVIDWRDELYYLDFQELIKLKEKGTKSVSMKNHLPLLKDLIKKEESSVTIYVCDYNE